jgi:hypothetical protein
MDVLRMRWLAAPLFGLAWLLMAAVPAHAGGVVGDGTPASCTDAAYAAAFAGGGLVTFNCGPNPITISVTTKVVDAGETTTVDGGGLVTLDGGGTLQHYLVLGEGSLTLRRITLQNGNFGSGGAVFVDQQGSLRLEAVTIQDCEADGSDSDGGAVQNRGTLVVDGSRFLRNHADDGGGAINNNGGTVTIRSSTFISNTALNGGAINNAAGTMDIRTSLLLSNTVTNQGGGMFATSGTVEVTNVTIAANAAFRGGGIYGQASAQFDVLNSTIYANTASSAGGGVWNNTGGASANVIIKNTIVAGNDDANTGVLNCDGPSMRTLGHNLIGDGSCITAQAGDLQNTDPKLGPLADNGGISNSYLPLAGSPAINGGDNAGCPGFDQRGYPRPIGAACDIGAVEAGSALWMPALLRAP